MKKKDLEGAEVSAYDNFSKPGPSNEKLAPAGSDVAAKDLKGNSAYDNFSKPGPPHEKQAPAGSDFAVVSAYDNFSKPDPSNEQLAPAGSDVALEGFERAHVAEKVPPKINPSDNIVGPEPRT